MRARFAKFGRWLLCTAILSLGGVAAAACIPLACGASLSELVHQSHGMVGFVIGFAFCAGMALTSLIGWLFTGKSLLNVAMGLEGLEKL
jgi:hypothetical protein